MLVNKLYCTFIAGSFKHGVSNVTFCKIVQLYFSTKIDYIYIKQFYIAVFSSKYFDVVDVKTWNYLILFELFDHKDSTAILSVTSSARSKKNAVSIGQIDTWNANRNRKIIFNLNSSYYFLFAHAISISISAILYYNSKSRTFLTVLLTLKISCFINVDARGKNEELFLSCFHISCQKKFC